MSQNLLKNFKKRFQNGETKTKWRQTVKPETIQAIEAVLAKGDRVELIPVKEGVKVVHVKRKEVK